MNELTPCYSLTNQTVQCLTTLRDLQAKKIFESEFHDETENSKA
ncbi:hypothetical protein FF38_06633 [Lucilia cuprina]|uniref:Uncharacterized protein n=1 Tax=Lucilia cuprina TaxID=7375 RepID=A0A0L0C5D3_LUCCU|nr:hypothetical protein FF38_06633 [Lucilia cuprina]